MRIVMVEDHTLFRDGMKLLLPRLDPEAEIIEAAGCEEVLHGQWHQPPGLILLDLGLPGLCGTDGIYALRQAWPDSPLVVLSGEAEIDVVRAALTAGARGYILKSANAQEMISALKLVLAGGLYVPSHARTALPNPPIPSLTARQQTVLGLITHGLSNREIASHLGMSENTVRGHVTNLLSSLSARNRTEAARIAQEHGLLGGDTGTPPAADESAAE